MLINLVSVLFSVGFFGFVIYLVKRRSLREEYSLLWLALASGFVLLATFRHLIDTGGRAFGIYYPPAFLFLVWLGFISLILLNYAVVISRFKEDIKDLVQENALLRYDLRKLASRQEGADIPPISND